MSGSWVSESIASAGISPFSSNLGAKTGSSSTSFFESRLPNVVLMLIIR